MEVFTPEHIEAVQAAFDPSNLLDYPSMPTSEAEWHCHCAFYRLTVTQRDRAWKNEEALREEVNAQYKEIGEQAQIINYLQAELNDEEGLW